MWKTNRGGKKFKSRSRGIDQDTFNSMKNQDSRRQANSPVLHDEHGAMHLNFKVKRSKINGYNAIHDKNGNEYDKIEFELPDGKIISIEATGTNSFTVWSNHFEAKQDSSGRLIYDLKNN